VNPVIERNPVLGVNLDFHIAGCLKEVGKITMHKARSASECLESLAKQQYAAVIVDTSVPRGTWTPPKYAPDDFDVAGQLMVEIRDRYAQLPILCSRVQRERAPEIQELNQYVVQAQATWVEANLVTLTEAIQEIYNDQIDTRRKRTRH